MFSPSNIAESVWSFLRRQTSQLETVWSVSTFGAVAEFHGTGEDVVEVSGGDQTISLRCSGGSARIEFNSAMRAVGYEGLTKDPRLWSHGVAICLPEADAAMNARTVLTREDEDGLFDLGLGLPHLDACIRTEDPALVAALKLNLGKNLFHDCIDLVHQMTESSPFRVFHTALARIEVNTPIAKPGTVTPDGAHTHILPELLAHNRTHAATVPIPRGWLPVLTLYPANPVRDEHGEPREFDGKLHTEFQSILEQFGDPAMVALKQSIRASIAQGELPLSFFEPEDRHHRLAARVCLRQLRMTTADTPALRQWIEFFDRGNPGEENAPSP